MIIFFKLDMYVFLPSVFIYKQLVGLNLIIKAISKCIYIFSVVLEM